MMGTEKRLIVGFAVFALIVLIVVVVVSDFHANNWIVVHSGSFEKAEFVATKWGETLIYFEDGAIEPMSEIHPIRFRKGDKIVVERNGYGQMRARKLPSEAER